MDHSTNKINLQGDRNGKSHTEKLCFTFEKSVNARCDGEDNGR